MPVSVCISVHPWLRIFVGFCGYECGAHGLSRHSHATAEVTRPAFHVFRGCKRLVVFAFSAFFVVNSRLGRLKENIEHPTSNAEHRMKRACEPSSDVSLQAAVEVFGGMGTGLSCAGMGG
jgi:hypothetical protein